ncbi:MAG: hypothetical protein K2X43_07340 [Hyphomonadaceae bacterium]|nr:hypothetical protein [Hyphomonadaceae bacterium]
MIHHIGVVATVVFAVASLLGTAASGWILGEALAPVRAGALVGSLSLGLLLAALAVVIEGVRLALVLQGERIWRRSPFQGLAFAGPLWLACTGYCILMPLLALALVPLLPAGSHMLTVIAPAWAAVQIAAGLLPGIAWSGPQPATATETAHAALPPEPPAQLAARSTASADDFLRFLSRLSELPAGSKLPRRGRIGTNREILISQAGLAALVGRSKPTVRRWLEELERGERLTKRLAGKDTCILLQHAHKLNGKAHL